MDSVPATKNHYQENIPTRKPIQTLSCQSTSKLRNLECKSTHLGEAATVDECVFTLCTKFLFIRTKKEPFYAS